MFPVDQDKIRLDVTITMIFPLASECVIMVLFGQRSIIGQRSDDSDEVTLKGQPMWPFCLALQVALELARLLNRPHQVPLGARPT